jgi:hypothetical protein
MGAVFGVGDVAVFYKIKQLEIIFEKITLC